MPQLIAIGLVGGLVWVGYRAFKRQMDRVGKEMRDQQKTRGAKLADKLELGEDGVYRPKENPKDKNKS